MAQLHNIKPSITSMSIDDALPIHLAIRQSRHTPKKPQTKAKAKRIVEKKSVVNLLDKLSPAEMDAILNRLKK